MSWQKLSLGSLLFLAVVTIAAFASGLWVLIAFSMLAFAAGSSLGWISLNPEPLIWANGVFAGLMLVNGICAVLTGRARPPSPSR